MTLDDVIPPSGSVTLSGGIVCEFKPINMGLLPSVLRALSPIGDYALGGELPDVSAMMAEHGDNVIDLVSIAGRIDRAAVEAMAIDDFLLCLGAIIEINADFFQRRVVPELEKITDRLVKSIGRKSSSD